MKNKILPPINLQAELEACAKLVNQKIDQLLSAKNSPTSSLMKAMRYSALSSAKRIRPFLIINCAKLFDISKTKSINVAIALEFIHIYSLIHDDLPAMDNDDYRRGELTCHKKFDEATAILAGDALLTYAFEILASPKTHKDANIRCKLINLMSQAAGFNGMVGGQMLDLELNKQKLSKIQNKEKIIELQKLKTGQLFIAATKAAAIIAKANSKKEKALEEYAANLGLAFQISDDLLDYKHEEDNKSSPSLTKPNQSDNTNIIGMIGVIKAKNELELLKNKALMALEVFGSKANILRILTEFIITRKK
jgi:farnesyl diphosphate synthase